VSKNVQGLLKLNKPQRIACFHLNQLGDLLFSLPALYNLRRAFPEAHIASVVRPNLRSLLEMSRLVDEVVERPYGTIWTDIRVSKNLREKKFDIGVLFSTSPAVFLISVLAGIPFRIGFAYSPGRFLLSRTAPFVPPPSTRNNLELVKVMGCSVEKTDYVGLIKPTVESHLEAKRLLASAGLDESRHYAVLGPGTSGGREVKRWSDEGFAQVAARLAAEYSLRSIVVGASSGSRIPQINSDVVDLTGRTSVGTLAAILERASLFVGVDSGVMHLAAAVGTPVVALFGPTDPTVTGPQGEGHQVVYMDLPCRPCLKKECKIGRMCMEDITADKVVTAASYILNRGLLDRKNRGFTT
jgi:lipopolysaccharide heptosyltransferase II